ncbi:MAG: hypothetical protein ABL993_04740 [Vicinamibacterales bacterium]
MLVSIPRWIARLPLLVAACTAPAILLEAQPGAPLLLSQLTWFDRTGRALGTIGTLADHGNIELSPDGRTAAAAVNDRELGTHDIWMYPTSGGTRTRFTSDSTDENWLIFGPDSARVIFNSFGPGRLDLFQAPASNSAGRRVLLDDAVAKWPVSWSPDGQHLLYVTSTPDTGNDIWVLPLTGDRRPFPFLNGPESENWAAFSPDGRWVVFSSTATGRSEVYVTGFPDGGGFGQISETGGSQARWRRNGEIVYLAPDRRLMAAKMRVDGNEIELLGVEELFAITFPYGSYHAFDVTADGQRILVNTTIVSPDSPTLTVSNEVPATASRVP